MLHQTLAQPTKLLIFAANPLDEQHLRIEEEIRAIQNALNSHLQQSAFHVHVHVATRPTDIQHMLRDYQPNIVHFCGHGSEYEGLLVQSEDGFAQAIDTATLGNLFRLYRGKIRCVVLNACYSEAQALAIAAHIDIVIGMSGAVADTAASRFAAEFYGALAHGWSVGEAFDSGILGIELADLIDCDMPKIISNQCDPHGLWLLPGKDLRQRLQTVLDVSYYDRPELVREATRQFVGRQKLLRSICRDLRRGQRVLLTGLGGIGKTSIAAAVAQDFLTNSESGLPAVLWVRCGGESPIDILDAVADRFAQIGVDTLDSGFGALPLDSKIDRLRRAYLGSNVRLIVLDDAHYSEQMDLLLMTIPPNTPVLTTSRVRLPSEKSVEVMELAANDAATLLSFHAGAPAIRATWDALELCGMLGFHPYAVELAGKLLQVFQMTPGLLIQRIKDRPVDLAQGNRSVRSLLEECVGILPPAAKHVFLCFGQLVAAGASTRLLSCYAEEPIAFVLEGLDTLLERSLVRRPDRASEFYTMHDLVFHYARLLSQETTSDALNSATPILRYLATGTSDVEIIRQDITNILGVAENAKYPDLLRIMSILTIGGYPDADPPSYFDIYGHSGPYLRLLDKVLAMIGVDDDCLPVTRHYLLGKRADAYGDLGLWEEAAASLNESLIFAPSLQREAHILSCIAGVSAELGKIIEAEQLLDHAQEIADTAGLSTTLAVILLQRSLVAGEGNKDPAMALEYCRRAIAILRGEPSASADLARALLNLGTASIELNDLGGGMTAYREAENLFVESNDQFGLGQTYFLMGIANQDANNDGEARSYLRRAAEAFLSSGASGKLREVQAKLSLLDAQIGTGVRVANRS